MRTKLFCESKFTSKAQNAATLYLEKIEFKKTALNIPALLIFLTLGMTFCVVLFFK